MRCLLMSYRFLTLSDIDALMMRMRGKFRGKSYEVVFTEHAKLQMELRELEETSVLEVIETGEIKPKNVKNKFWVYKSLLGRRDNLISVSVSIETPRLIVITTLVNWSPV